MILEVAAFQTSTADLSHRARIFGGGGGKRFGWRKLAVRVVRFVRSEEVVSLSFAGPSAVARRVATRQRQSGSRVV